MTLYWHEAGPLMKYDGEVLLIENLNPQIETKWRMARWEMFLLGCKCIAASIRALKEKT